MPARRSQGFPAATFLLRCFPLVLPLAVRWARRTEAEIVRLGRELREPNFSDAIQMGVRHPERVRLLEVDRIPLPRNPILFSAAKRAGLVSPALAGLSLRYGIYLRSSCAGTRHLIAHECAHTAQYERLGGLKPFLDQYLRECLEVGYPGAPLEQEAIEKAAPICG